jgi:hypothetical protein
MMSMVVPLLTTPQSWRRFTSSVFGSDRPARATHALDAGCGDCVAVQAAAS